MFSTALVNEARRIYFESGVGRAVCPVCMGGASHEDSLSIYVDEADGRVRAKCHRANCLTQGYVHTIHDGPTVTVPEAKQPPRSYTARSSAHYLSDALVKQFSEARAFVIPPGIVQSYVKTVLKDTGPDTPGQGWVFPIYNFHGDEIGCVVRPWHPKKRKSLTFGYGDETTLMGWYRGGYLRSLLDEDVYVVEDPISAICLSSLGVVAVSLNGTGLSRQRLDELLSHHHRVILMLDADATRQALKYCIMYGPDVIRVVRLVDDIKDTPRERVEELLNEIE